MSSNNTFPVGNGPSKNPRNETRGVDFFEAKDVEIHQDGNLIAAVTVRGKPGAVNFVAKTADPHTTVSISKSTNAEEVVAAQLAHLLAMSDGPCRIRAEFEIVARPGTRQGDNQAAMAPAPREDEAVGGQPDVNNPQA